jgi:type II secretory pathway pseudopilin PulG
MDPWWRSLLHRLLRLLLPVLLALLLLGYLVWYLGYRLYRIGRELLRRPLKPASPIPDSFLLVAIIGILAVLTFANLRTGPSGSFRATSATKTAVTQAIVYANDKGVYPTSLKVMRDSGYANVRDDDPWGVPYRLSLVLTRGKTPKEGDNVYIYSKGPQGTGTYPRPFTNLASARGSIGYSSIYGAWRGE